MRQMAAWDAYVYTQGALMGAAEGTPFAADERRPGRTVQDLIAAHAGLRGQPRGRPRLGRHRPGDPAAPVQRFPNMTFLANAGHVTLICSRPGPDPDHREMVIFLMTRMPPGAPRSKPADVRSTAGEAEPGLVLTQDDIQLLAGLQRGLHQPGVTQLTLSSEERRVINLYRNLERYLDLPEAERIRDGEKVPT
jgi:choline monooxygenase